MSAKENLKKNNIILPKAADPVGAYVATKKAGNLLFVSGQISMNENGELIKGKLGKDLDVNNGYKAAERCALSLIAQAKKACNDDLSQINKSKLNKASTIVFSPGPGSPKDYPESSKIYNRFKGKKKIIGICLGFQQILYCEGANIVEQKKIYHGFQSEIITNKFSNLFDNGSKFKVGRYHSLKLKEPFYAKNFM